MKDDQQALLDDLLIRWHQWRSAYKPARGFNGRSLVVGEYVTSRQYDDENGALDDAIENRIMRQTDFEICELEQIHYVAICVVAQALTVGAAVFCNPRLPKNPDEKKALIDAARMALIRRVVAAGII